MLYASGSHHSAFSGGALSAKDGPIKAFAYQANTSIVEPKKQVEFMEIPVYSLKNHSNYAKLKENADMGGYGE